MNASEVLGLSVSIDGVTRRFGEVDAQQAGAQAQQLAGVARTGPLARAAPIAWAWAELARALQPLEGGTVADLPEPLITDFARRTWVLPPELLP